MTNPHAALESLRADVFRSGQFFSFDPDEMDPVSSADELVEAMEETGTHSIIDMVGVANATEEFEAAVYPMDETALQAVFGSLTPSREEAESRVDDLWQHVGSGWTGRYFPTYRDGSPDGLFFIGFSGD